MENEVHELLEMLYTMIADAWGVPLGNEKCIIERDKALNLLEEVKTQLPLELAEAKRLVAARDEFIKNARREAESMRRAAEEHARHMVEEQEIVRVAKAKSAEMISSAEAKSNELRRVASDYVDDIMRQTEESVSAALAGLQNVRGAFRKAVAPAPKAAEPAPKEEKPARESKGRPFISSFVPDLGDEEE